MVNRRNYLWVKEHLLFVEDIRQVKPATVERYWFHLKHLLLWADEALLSLAETIRPTFPNYLSTSRLDGSAEPLAPESLRKIVQSAKRFFHWARVKHHGEFRGMSEKRR